MKSKKSINAAFIKKLKSLQIVTGKADAPHCKDCGKPIKHFEVVGHGLLVRERPCSQHKEPADELSFAE